MHDGKRERICFEKGFPLCFRENFSLAGRRKKKSRSFRAPSRSRAQPEKTWLALFNERRYFCEKKYYERIVYIASFGEIAHGQQTG